MVVLEDCLFVLAVVDNLAALVGLCGGLEVHKAARVFPVFKDMYHGRGGSGGFSLSGGIPAFPSWGFPVP